MKQNSSTPRAIRAGVTATAVWTLIMYAGPLIGLHQVDIAGILSSLLIGAPVFPFTGLWFIGLILHFVIGGVVFASVYATWLYEHLSGPAWMRGTQWGMILWLLSMVFFMPIAGAGLFAISLPTAGLLVFSSLIGHLVYGWLFGLLAGPQRGRISDRAAASATDATRAARSMGFVK